MLIKIEDGHEKIESTISYISPSGAESTQTTLARAVVPRDQPLDEMNSSASRRLIERMAEDPGQLRGYLNLIFISRCLERVGDHATNMAEDAVYAAAAEDIRHQHFVPAAS